MAHTQKMESPCTFYVVTRSGKEFTVWADEIIEPNDELGLVRFKLDGEVVGVTLANQFAAWRTSVPPSE